MMCKKLTRNDPERLEQFRNGTGREPGCTFRSENTNNFDDNNFRNYNAPTFRTRGRIISKTRTGQTEAVLKKSRSSCGNLLEDPIRYYSQVTNDRPDEFARVLFSRQNLNRVKNMVAYTIKQQYGLDITPEAQDEQQIMDRFISKYNEYIRDITYLSMEPAQAEFGDLRGMLNELDDRIVCDLVKETIIGIRQHLTFMTAPLNSDHMIPVGQRPHFGIDSRKEFNDERRTLNLEGVIGMPQIAPRLSMLVRGQI